MTRNNDIKARFHFAAFVGGMTLYAALLGLSVFAEIVV